MPENVDPRRVRRLDQRSEGSGQYVLYWMQRSQRAFHNHALEFAIDAANERKLPVLVLFALTADYPEAQERHYRFMVEGLADVEKDLETRGIPFLLRLGNPPDVAAELAQDAQLVVCDRAYLRHLRKWRRAVAEAVACPVYEVETDVVVPLESASTKREFAARTIRRKIMSKLDEFCRLPREGEPSRRLASSTFADLSDPAALLDSLQIRRDVAAVSQHFTGGSAEGMRRATELFDRRLYAYTKNRNQPKTDDTSHASMYLHFGHISPIWLVQEARQRSDGASGSEADAIRESVDSFIEELVVRRELAHNYVFFEPNYDSYDALPPWAQTTLAEHEGDERPYIYSRDELEAAATHDEYWNAAQREMLHTGYMHNYMRMYWGKKILEWSPTPREAFVTTLSLNNTYFLDGRDPNSYANVGWIFGLHDRPWQERPIFGKVRIMKASGLERKCDMSGYLDKVARLDGQGELFPE